MKSLTITRLVGDMCYADPMLSLPKQHGRKQLIDEWTSELEQLRSLLKLAQNAPREMRRHHSLVFESARWIDSSVADMHWVVHEHGSIARDAHSMILAANSAHVGLDSLLEACRDDAMRAHRSLVRDCVRECKLVVSLAFSIRNALSAVCDKSTHLRSQLSERASMLRAGAQAIHDNLSADDAEDHVRRLYVDVPHEWKRPWGGSGWLK